MNTALLIFTKYPHPGNVKTRLAATVGQMLATEFHARCAENTFRQADAVQDSMDVSIWYAGVHDEDAMRSWIANTDHSFPIIPQLGKDLGERLKYAAVHTFETSAATSVLIIGTDTPDISSDILRQARIALLTKDIVIGPAFDGGYYLIGMNHFYPSLFEDIAWSSPVVTLQTIEKAKELNLSIAMLDLLIDIDTIHDLNHWLLLETTPHNHPLYPLALQIRTHE